MSKRNFRQRSKSVLLWLVIVIALLAVSGSVYQLLAAAADNRTYKPRGQMVDVGGRRLHLVVAGENKGQPVVILEAGMATFSSNWHWVQAELAADTRVVSYDRAGLGWSDPAPETHTAYDSAADLHAALQKAGIAGPYVLAGHSYGGLVVRAFADLYADEVAGLVLVDASHPDQWARIPASRNGRLNAFGNRITAWAVRLGIARLVNLAGSVTRGLPEQQAGEMQAILNQPRSWVVSGKTLAIWNDQTRPRINQAQGLGDLPLVVLSVTDQPSLVAETLTSLQAELPVLSSNSAHYTVEGATHEGLVAEQEHAKVVEDAIRQVLQAAQTGRPVAEMAVLAPSAGAQ